MLNDTHRCFLLAVLLNFQLAVAVTAQYDGVVLPHSQVAAATSSVVPSRRPALQMLPALASRKGPEDNSDIVCTCVTARQYHG